MSCPYYEVGLRCPYYQCQDKGVVHTAADAKLIHLKLDSEDHPLLQIAELINSSITISHIMDNDHCLRAQKGLPQIYHRVPLPGVHQNLCEIRELLKRPKLRGTLDLPRSPPVPSESEWTPDIWEKLMDARWERAKKT